MAATKMFFITWFSSSTHSKVDQLILDMFFTSGFGYAGFSDLKDFWARNLPDDFHEVFQTTSRKSSGRVFNQMVLIFHLDISGSDFGRLMGSLPRSLLKYNVLKSSRRLPGSLPDDFQEVF
ncbi:hypothetical protein F2Q69_00059492 [Brassica cretica]|uniref:Uncharacterized protein n=1 Tax=Brassica cretica TaxID=69181 RepID=A0A8S9RQT0_BRACR|nr:hypothetical protein F2Q69_00059492 [Brassica cretica]